MAKFALVTLTCIFLLEVVGSYANPTGRIVGGNNAIEGQFPHQVSLRRSGSPTCGASIISQYFILTAAHCVGTEDSLGVYRIYDLKTITIRAGSIDRVSGGVVISVAQVIPHEAYGHFINDIALLKLAQPLSYSSSIQPIALATSNVFAGERVTISGWGRLWTDGDSPQKLQWNILTAITTSECQAKIGMGNDALICLAHDYNNGACKGDSGGPAVFEGKLVGVAGFIVGGCGSSNPDGYTNVYYHNKWIQEHASL